MLKRIIALLAALLLLCCMPLSAYAVDELVLIEDDTEDSAEGQIELITADDEADSFDFGQNTAQPDWFPENVETFELFNDSEADRVVDRADIFTPEDEDAMRSLIADISSQAQKDIVVYTDTTAYGKEQRITAADFYDFNGYGIGPDCDGIILFICMDPLDRGWQNVPTGSVKSIFKADYETQIGDRIYTFLASGRYGEGVLDWITNIGNLYLKGMPFAPSWYGEAHQPLSESDSRVFDDAGMLTAEQRVSLDSALKTVRDKYGIEAVVHTTLSSYEMGDANYTRAFYDAVCHGENGSVLVFFRDGGLRMYRSGSVNSRITERTEDKITDEVYRKYVSGGAYSGAMRWAEYLGKAYKTGRVPISPEKYISSAWTGTLVGAFVGIISLVAAGKNMKVVKKAVTADDNIVKDSFKVEQSDHFINTTVSRVYSPMPKDNNRGSGRGGGGGGHSSFGGSFSGSSGVSHTSSGGRF